MGKKRPTYTLGRLPRKVAQRTHGQFNKSQSSSIATTCVCIASLHGASASHNFWPSTPRENVIMRCLLPLYADCTMKDILI